MVVGELKIEMVSLPGNVGKIAVRYLLDWISPPRYHTDADPLTRFCVSLSGNGDFEATFHAF